MTRWLIACIAAASLGASAQVQPTPGETAQRVDSVRQAMRGDRRALVEKNMQLTPQEARAFWPLYDDYQRDLDRIAQRQNRAIIDYINTERVMTDANARRIAREVLKADGDEQSLRERTFRKMLSALPARKAVRWLQIENKLRTLQRYDIAERIPLVQ
jgi:hypothetical protein